MPPSRNWHWRTARAEPYAKSWLSEEILKCEAGGLKPASIDVEGDCEVGMRKSKLITVYDLVVTTKWTAADGAIKGTLTCPEVGHDMPKSDYVFESAIEEGGADADKHRQVARTELADQIRDVFDRFHAALIAKHQFILVDEANDDSPSGSGTSTPAGAAAPGAKPAPAFADLAIAAPNANPSVATNTSTVKVEANLHVTAEDLFELLTNGESKVPMWTRNPAKMKPEVGAEVSLFGGNITGTMKSVDRPRGFVTSWRAPGWPEGHFGELTTKITQQPDTTDLVLSLSGVPRGKEDETERNLDTFYIRGLKSIGLGTML